MGRKRGSRRIRKARPIEQVQLRRNYDPKSARLDTEGLRGEPGPINRQERRAIERTALRAGKKAGGR